MNHDHFVLDAVATAGPKELSLSFADGQRFVVSLADVINKHPTLAPLEDPAVFRTVSLDEWNRGVVFADDDALSLASDNLRALAVEQSGEFSHQQLIAWMAHHAMTLDMAAEALDVSRRMLAYYRSGSKAIPRTVGLAMLGWDVYTQRGAEHAFEYEAAA